ncbi:DUF2087 domain-containing protein [Clostridium neuense]|uniref:DUF2087 domain-containing protein n=1 Tax=Clostridium neuense TaxID=1728934 RepID=A0ABW8TAZ7_9CLOT
MDISEVFWNSSIEDIKKGYVYDEGKEVYICLICGETFEKGMIYKYENSFYEAEKYMRLHISKKHVSVFDYLINMNKVYTGLTDIQREYLMHYKNNFSDKEISEKMGGSQSTIRNYRFKLREKEKQAKVFLAIMDSIKDEKESLKQNKNEELITVHRTANMTDERFAITEDEEEKVIKNYFDKEGHLKEFPSKEKKKIIVLRHILKSFKSGEKYNEKQVNLVLKRMYDDYVSLRRALIEYGFMDRKDDCSQYWVKE